MKTILINFLHDAAFLFPAFVGGFVDYFNQIQKGAKKWSIAGFFTHLVSALFFGWVCGSVASGIDYSTHVVSASGGIGGFLGVRVADLIAYKLKGNHIG